MYCNITASVTSEYHAHYNDQRNVKYHVWFDFIVWSMSHLFILRRRDISPRLQTNDPQSLSNLSANTLQGFFSENEKIDESVNLSLMELFVWHLLETVSESAVRSTEAASDHKASLVTETVFEELVTDNTEFISTHSGAWGRVRHWDTETLSTSVCVCMWLLICLLRLRAAVRVIYTTSVVHSRPGLWDQQRHALL